MDELNIYDSEIPPKQILKQMKSKIYDDFYTKKFSSINKAYIYSRKNLFNILHKITNAIGFKSQTFFLCAHYLDIIFSSNNNINININLVGLSALCLSAKYCENDPIVPHLQYFIKVYNVLMGYKNFLFMNDLKVAEVSVLKILDYKLNYFTVYDFNSFFFSHGILKLEQIKEIAKYKNKNSHKNAYINQVNSLMIKNILEKIYKKSRYYLDIIVNKTKLCFKYNSLYLSILIMKKSVNEILAHEQNINLCDINEQIDFYQRNSLCFKEIMTDFYNIDYEANDQYKKLIKDEEIKEIFEEKKIKGVENYPPPPITAPKEEKKDDEKENNYRINKINNYRINKKDNKIFNSSVSNGFYQRLEINEEEANKEKTSRMKRNTFYKSKEKSRDKTFDNIKVDFNMNEFQNSYRKIKTMKNKLNNANKSDYNIHNKNQEEIEEKEEKEMNISKKRFIPRIETYNNFNYRNTICNLKSSEKTFHVSKFCLNLNKNKEEKNNSTIEYDDKTINNNYSNSKFIKIKGLNNGKVRKDYSFSITENYNNNENSKLNKKSCDKKLYYKKNIYQSNDIENYSSLNFNSTNNINLNISNNKNKMNSNNAEESLNRKKNLIINKYYTRINLKIPNNEKNVLNTSINLGNDNTFQNNNTINQNENHKIITSSTRYRRRFLYNTMVNNKKVNKNIENISDDNIKEQEQERNTINIMALNNNKNEIESYISKNDSKGLTSLNFYRNSNMNKISVNTIKKISENDKEMNKSFISGNKNKITYLLGKQNSQLNNTLKEINIAFARNINEERTYNREKSKEKEKELEINYKKENKNNIRDDSNKDKNIKINQTKSIRQKYLNNNRNNRNNKNSSSNINNNEKKSEEKNVINKSEYNTIKSRYSSRNNKIKAKINYNENEYNNIKYNNKKIIETEAEKVKEKEEDNNGKNKTKYSFYKAINKTKSFYATNNNEENKTKNEKDNENRVNMNHNLSFYKSQNNFYRTIKTDKNYEEQRSKEEITKNQQDKKIGSNNNYISNEYLKHRYIYRRSNIPTPSNINNSFINYTKGNNNDLQSKNKNETNYKGLSNNNIISKFHYYRKTINKDINNRKNYHPIIDNKI